MGEPGERKGQAAAAPSLAYDPATLLCKYIGSAKCQSVRLTTTVESKIPFFIFAISENSLALRKISFCEIFVFAKVFAKIYVS
jgi:hypothetical protein